MFILSSSTLLLLLNGTVNFLFVHQCKGEQYNITGLIESHEEAKSFCQSQSSCEVSFFRGREKKREKDPKTEKKEETGRPNFTNSQTDIGCMGEGGTAAVHSRRGRDVSEW